MNLFLVNLIKLIESHKFTFNHQMGRVEFWYALFILYANSSQTVALKPAALASSGIILLEMHILGPIPEILNQRLWR